MDWKSELISLAKQYGPTIGLLIIGYYRDQVIKARHDQAVAELEMKHLENKALIDEKYKGLSSADVVAKAQSGSGSGV